MLEQFLCDTQDCHSLRQTLYFSNANLESLSASVLYDGDSIKFSKDAIIIPYKWLGISGLHDTYKVDKDGNLSDGHTTINLKNDGKVFMPHGFGSPSIKKGS